MKIIPGHVVLDNLYLKEVPEILSTVDKIEGYFSITDNNITSLKNCPVIVGKSVYVGHNDKIINLIGGPEIVGKDYSAPSCKQLISLQGIPKIIPGTLYLTSNFKLIDFTYFPEKIGIDFEVGHFYGGNRRFPEKFTEDFFRSICDIGGKVKINRWDF